VLPADIDDDTAAASMLKGMTAEYLLHRTHRVHAGETVLVHAAAGGVGLFLCAWAKALGARVIGTVSSEEKARIAREHGCDVTIVTRDRFAAAVRAATDGHGADVIYDGLGAPGRDENLDALAACGHWVVYGQAGGPHTALDADALAAKSGTLSRPVLFHYTAQRAQLESIARNLFAALRNGTVRPRIVHRYPLAAAADAQRDLEARRTTGQLLLLP
jgi:NADPH:quinone reductase-like Zn-dependent oxidoreductase